MGRDFLPVQTGPGAHPASCTMGTGSFPGVKCGRGVLLTTHSLLALRSWKSRAISLPIIWVTTGPVTGTLYLFMSFKKIIVIIRSLVSPTHAGRLTHVLLINRSVWKPVGFSMTGVGFHGQPLASHDVSV